MGLENIMNSFRRLIYSMFTIFLALTAIFFVVRMAPGDPVMKILGPEATLEEINKYREQLGLNLPVYRQYTDYIVGLFKLDLGESLFKRKEVSKLIMMHIRPTIILAFVSVCLSTLFGIFGGILAGRYKSGIFDNGIRVVSLIALSFPIFSLAPVLVCIFSIKYGIFPVSEWDGSFLHAFLPVLTLVIPLTAVLIRVVRNKYLEEVSAPWIQVLRAKGMSDLGIQLRLVKISMPSILNVVAIQLSVVLAGTMITETIFDIPGMGMLLFDSIQNRDYPLVQGIIVYSTVIYMTVYFLVDFLNTKIDPRIEN